MPEIKAPYFAKKFLHWYCNEEYLEEFEGDLNEEYLSVFKKEGAFSAKLFYFSEVIRFLRSIRSERTYQSKNRIAMIENYLKIAFRNIKKYKAYSYINISGLAIGLACAFIILLFVKTETSYDKFHKDGENIYRLQHVYGFINALAGPGYKQYYPGVKDALRILTWRRDRKISIDDKKVYYQDVLMADPNLFTFFSFPVIEGDPNTFLTSNDQVVISQRTAEKYFGKENPIGQVLRIEGMTLGETTSFKVSGVFEDIPYNSHLKFDLVVPFDILYHDPMIKALKSWPTDWVGTYLRLDENTDPNYIKDEYANLRAKYWEPDTTTRINIMPLEDLYLDSYDLNNDYAEHGNIAHVRIFTAIAILIIIIACINFMNLATAQSAKRSKEVGVRKVMGAIRKNLVIQFFSESFIMTLMAFLLAVGLVLLAIPWVNNAIDIDLYQGFNDLTLIISLAATITLVTFLIAGSYPALFLSSFQPASILAGKGSSGKSTGVIRKVLVVFQFSISVILIIGAIVVFNQMSFMQNKELGFDKEQILIANYGSVSGLKKKWPVIKAELKNQPNVSDVMMTFQVPGDNAFYWGYKFEGYNENPHGEGWRGFYIGENMVEGLGMEVVLGRSFSPDIPSDSNAFMLNEAAWEQAITEYGADWKEPLGRTIEYHTSNSGQWQMEKKGVVVGIIKDFHHHSLQKPIEPIVIHNFGGSKVLVKTKTADISKLTDFLSQNWEKWGSKVPFEYKFLDDDFNEHYKSEERFGTFLVVFCSLAIFIACLGLFGLASFIVEQKTKEIGIRKVLGASVQSIVQLLSSEFMKLVGMAILIATPISYFVFQKWLENFSFRIGLSWSYFVIAFIIAILIAMITVSFHSLKASIANPVKSLRVE